MKIRTSFLFLSLFFIISIAAIGLISFHVLNQTTTGFDETVGANQMIKDLFELNILALEYSIHQEERMVHQWRQKFDTLGEVIKQGNLHFKEPERIEIIRDIESGYHKLHNLFLRLQDSVATRKTLEEKGADIQHIELAKELENRLLASVLIQGRRMTAGALRLFDSTKENMAHLERRTGQSLLFGILGAVFFLSVISVLIIRSVTLPLRDLTRSTKIFGTGDMTHRTPVKTHNEIGQLGMAFNEMAKKLEATTVSRDQLSREVKAREEAETGLRKTRDQLFALFDGISDPLMMMTKKGFVEIMNRAAQDYYGVRFQNANEDPCYAAFRNRTEPCPGCGIFRAISEKNYTPFERNGIMNSHQVERISLYPVTEEEEGKEFIIVRISDVTEEKRTQKRAIQNEKLLSMGFLISGIAHEMNNPNSFISMNTPILKEYIEAIIPIVDDYASGRVGFEPCDMPYAEFREDLYKLIGNIEHGSLRINQTVSRLKGLVTRHEELQIEAVSLKTVVENSLDICRSRASAGSKTLEIDLPNEFPVIRTDPVALEQVLTNVIVNAVHATETESVWVQLRVFRREENGARTIIEITDRGCGMSETVKKRLFDPFFTDKPKGVGSGLGLYVCQSLLGALGGHMEAESEPGKGSLFRIVLYESPLGEINHG